MSVGRRKRKTLTNVVSNLDSRLRGAELRQVKVGSGRAVESLSTIAPSTGIGTVVSDSAPSDFIKILGGRYYSKRVTGSVDALELYLSSDTGVSTDDTVTISGLRSPYVLSGDFVVTQVNPEGEDRPSYLASIPAGITSSLIVTTGQDIPISESAELISKYEIESYSTGGTTTEATVVFTSNHTFEVGDIINTSDLPSPFPGLDGIYRISAKTSNSITYEFIAQVGAPIEPATPGAEAFIYAVVQKKTAVGDTWIETAGGISTTYYWTGLRWSTSRSAGGEGGQDELAPADVSNVTSITGAYTIDGGVPRSSVTLSWEAPTENSDGTPLTDLAGYDVWLSYTEPDSEGNTAWTEKTGLLSADTSTIISGLNQDVLVWFKIFAVDSSLNRSEGVIHSQQTSIFALELNAPSAPSLTSRLGTITAEWNGKDVTNSRPPASIRSLEVHASNVNAGFIPNSDPDSASYTLVATMVATTEANYAVISGLEYTNPSGVPYDWYVKFVAVDANGNRSAASSAASIQVSRTGAADITAGVITADKLNVGNVAAGLVSANVLRANNLANTAGFELNATTFRAYSNGVDNFRIHAANGLVQIGAGTTISGNSITTGVINASLITAGSLSANRITTGTLNAANVTVTNLSANAITTGTLNAGLITVTNLSANAITTGTFNASNVTVTGTISGSVISGGEIIGTRLTTASSGRRVSLQNTLAQFFDESNNFTGSIFGAGTDRGATLEINGPGSGSVSVWSGGVALDGAGGAGAYLSDNGFGIFGQQLYVYDVPLEIAGGNPTLKFSKGFVNPTIKSLTLNDSGQFEAEGFRASGNLNVAGEIFYSAPTSSTSGQPVHRNTGTNRLYGFTSASRFKKNIQDIQVTPELMQAFLDIPIKQFNPIEDDTDLVYGYIAEDLDAAGFRNLVVYEEDVDSEGNPTGNVQPLTLDFYSINALGQHIIKQQNRRITDLEETVKTLVTRVQALEGGS